MNTRLKIIFTFFALGVLFLQPALAEDHDHGHEEEAQEEHHDHDEAEEESSGVGADKGVLAATSKDGIQLSPEALKNFEIKTRKLSALGPWSLPGSAVVQSLNEINLYRLRNGFFKRVDFTKTGSGASGEIKISSPDLAAGDEVVIHGISFLRIAEIAAFGGNAAGHSH